MATVNLEKAKPFCETKAELSRWAKSAYTSVWNMDSTGMVMKTLWDNTAEDSKSFNTSRTFLRKIGLISEA